MELSAGPFIMITGPCGLNAPPEPVFAVHVAVADHPAAFQNLCLRCTWLWLMRRGRSQGDAAHLHMLRKLFRHSFRSRRSNNVRAGGMGVTGGGAAAYAARPDSERRAQAGPTRSPGLG
jgi:hypothetical protein